MVEVTKMISLWIVLGIGFAGLIYVGSIVWINAIDKFCDAMTVNKLFRQFMWDNKHLFWRKKKKE